MDGGHDAILIGGRHDGLAAGTHLTRDGLRAVVLEAHRKVERRRPRPRPRGGMGRSPRL